MYSIQKIDWIDWIVGWLWFAIGRFLVTGCPALMPVNTSSEKRYFGKRLAYNGI